MARAAQLSRQDLERLSDDPRNKVFEDRPESEHAAWDPDVIEPMLRAVHSAFVAHALARPQSTIDEDEDAAVAIVKAGGDDMVRMAKEHPSLVGKLTTRSSALDPTQMAMVWTMCSLRRDVHCGKITSEDAQRQLVQSTLMSFVKPAARTEEHRS